MFDKVISAKDWEMNPLLTFFNSLTYSRVTSVKPNGPLTAYVQYSDDVKVTVPYDTYERIPLGSKERFYSVEAESFVGYACCGDGQFRFESENYCDLSDSLCELTKTGTKVLPRPMRVTQVLEDRGNVYAFSPKRTVMGDLIFGVVDKNEFVKWFVASEQFYRFYKMVLNGPTHYNKLGTVEQVLNGNSRLVVDSVRKRIVAGLPRLPYNVLRSERVSRQYLHVYVAAALKHVFEVDYKDYKPRVEGVVLEWEIPSQH